MNKKINFLSIKLEYPQEIVNNKIIRKYNPLSLLYPAICEDKSLRKQVHEKIYTLQKFKHGECDTQSS